MSLSLTAQINKSNLHFGTQECKTELQTFTEITFLLWRYVSNGIPIIDIKKKQN
jgi:hypothetical protein